MPRPHDPLDQVNLLELRPVRVAAWSDDESTVAIERPKPSKPWFRSPGEWLSYQMSSRWVRLDERGSFVWRSLDGDASVGEVARRLREEYGDDVDPAEERVGLLVRALRVQGLLAYPEWDERASDPVALSKGRSPQSPDSEVLPSARARIAGAATSHPSGNHPV